MPFDDDATMDNEVTGRKTPTVEVAVARNPCEEGTLGAVIGARAATRLAVTNADAFARLGSVDKIANFRMQLHTSGQHVRVRPEMNAFRDQASEKVRVPGALAGAVRGMPSRATAARR